MELIWQQETVPALRECGRLSRSAQIAMESVVPDTRDDIGRILSVRPEIRLKSRDRKMNGIVLSGEALVRILYLNDTESAIRSFESRQDFSLDYDLPDADESSLLTTRLQPGMIQARVVNPRKVSVDLELKTCIIVYSREETVVSQRLPAGDWPRVHTRCEETECVLIRELIEKPFHVNEQLAFPEGMPRLREVLTTETELTVLGKEFVSGRLLIRGQAELSLFGLTEESGAPTTAKLQSPFSLLVEPGGEGADQAEIWTQISACRTELIDALDGQQLLELELGATAQIVLRGTQKISFISDAYCNLMACECKAESPELFDCDKELLMKLEGSERVEAPEEAGDLLALLPTPGVCSAEQGSVSAELLFPTGDGQLLTVRRTIHLQPVEAYAATGESVIRLRELSWTKDGREYVLKAAAEGTGRRQSRRQIRRIRSLTLDEEKLIDRSCYPSMTAVWANTESVWELAKAYHSSPEAILALNETPGEQPILIPKTKD